MSSSRFVAAAGAFAVALSVALYLPTFDLSFAYDDVDYLNVGAAALSGETGMWAALFHPHAEHLVVGFQALFFPYLRFFGVDAMAWRAGVAVVHALSAIFLALLARRYSGSDRAGFVAAFVYIGACGFTSMWIWFPTAAPVPLMTALLTGSAALLAWRDRLPYRRLLAGAAVVLALITESAFAPMALLPAMVDEYERRREGRRGLGLLSVWTLVAIVATAVLMATFRGDGMSVDLAKGIPRAAYLMLVAPFRFFFPGAYVVASTAARFAILGSVIGVIIAATVSALLAALWRRGTPPLAVVAALSLPGSLGVMLLIGLGRSNATYHSLYETDRYFFPLLIPASLLAGAIVASISTAGWTRTARVLLFLPLSIAVLGEVALQRRAMLGPIPRIVYDKHEARFASLTRLAHMLDRAGPIELPRQTVWFSDLHNGQLRTSVLTDVLCRGCERLRLGSGRTVDAATETRLNTVLDQWARETGEPLPFLRVVEGRLVNTRLVWRVDFAQAAFERHVSGFEPWQSPYRWMGRRSEIRLTIGPKDLIVTLAAPITELRRRFGLESLTIRATLVDAQNAALSFPIGEAKLERDGVQSFTFSTAPFRSTLGDGRTARLVLDCDRTWLPEDASAEATPRSVQVFTAGPVSAP